MSTSVPGDLRQPSTKKPGTEAVATGGKPDDAKPARPDQDKSSAPTAKAAAGKNQGAKAAGSRTASGRASGGKVGGAKAAVGKVAVGKVVAGKAAGGKGKKPMAPVKVAQARNWGPIAMFTAAGLIAAGIIVFGAVQVYKAGHKPSWQDRAAAIPGIVNFRKSEPDAMKAAQHAWGVLTYKESPPVGGTHNFHWQNCMGDVYDKPIPKEQAVHSLEHGAVWVTYRPGLPADQVAKLASKVTGKSYMLMSPYDGLDAPISLQAWGYQLKLNSANDSRIDSFINALRLNATMEDQATCSGGITDTGTVPLDLGKTANPNPQTDVTPGPTG